MVTTRSASASYSVEVRPPKKLKLSTNSNSSIADISSSTSRIIAHLLLHVKVAPPKIQEVSAISTMSEIPKDLYDVIQGAAKCRKSLKLSSNNRFAKRKLEEYERRIPIIAMRYQCLDELPESWE